MSPAARAFWGAMLGALLTLAIHPASRPFVLGSAARIAPQLVSNSLDSTVTHLAPPKDLLGASLWVQIAFERIDNRHEQLRPDEIRSVLEVCDAAIDREQPQNAYWHQAKAVLLLQAGRREEALAEWVRASRYDVWRDFQTERLLHSQNLLESETGARQAWQYAYVYYARSDAGANLIEKTARELLTGADYTSKEGLAIRLATLLNGDLLRVGGRSLEVSVHGANIVELASYPANLTGTPTPKTLWIGRTELLANINKRLPKDEYERANEVFQYNDGWRALVLDDKYLAIADQTSLLALLAAQAPIATIAVMVFGAFCWIVGMGVGRWYKDRASFPTLTIGATTVLLSAGVYWLSENVAAAMAIGLSSCFLLIAPAHARTVRQAELGPLFTFVMLVLSVCSSVALGAYVIASSGPAVALASVLKVPQGYYERPALAGLSAVFLSLIFLAGPLWALVQRLPTPTVVATGLRRAGAMMGLGGLMLTVIVCPISVYFDRTLAETLSSLVGNEPVYHLQRTRLSSSE